MDVKTFEKIYNDFDCCFDGGYFEMYNNDNGNFWRAECGFMIASDEIEVISEELFDTSDDEHMAFISDIVNAYNKDDYASVIDACNAANVSAYFSGISIQIA